MSIDNPRPPTEDLTSLLGTPLSVGSKTIRSSSLGPSIGSAFFPPDPRPTNPSSSTLLTTKGSSSTLKLPVIPQERPTRNSDPSHPVVTEDLAPESSVVSKSTIRASSGTPPNLENPTTPLILASAMGSMSITTDENLDIPIATEDEAQGVAIPNAFNHSSTLPTLSSRGKQPFRPQFWQPQPFYYSSSLALSVLLTPLNAWASPFGLALTPPQLYEEQALMQPKFELPQERDIRFDMWRSEQPLTSQLSETTGSRTILAPQQSLLGSISLPMNQMYQYQGFEDPNLGGNGLGMVISLDSFIPMSTGDQKIPNNAIGGPRGHSNSHYTGSRGHNPSHNGHNMSYNSSSNHGPNSHRKNGNNRRYDVMNVHRKMHTHRRKGDDAAKYANAKLEDFTGEIYQLCRDQHGCRFLQRQIDQEATNFRSTGATGTNSAPAVTTTNIASTMIFNEIYLKIVELMVDPFGNYLIQKLSEHALVDERLILVRNAAPEFVKVALDPHGTRALQTLIECITVDEEYQLVILLLRPHIVDLSRDLNGNHVVQKCLQKFSAKNNQFIFDIALTHCAEIATHRHGCCVLQRCLDYGDEQQRCQLLQKVAQMATNLSLDPFGNYVVQYVLLRGDEELIENILSHIKFNVTQLLLQKFGLNVIEKLLRIPELSQTLVQVILQNQSHFLEMLNDPYGNYVLQTLLEVADKDNLTRLLEALQPLLPNIKNTPHGRRIISKIQLV